MRDRCRTYLEARVPDTPNHTRETIIIQCDRTPHRPGTVHRYKDEITWSAPKETL
ncbi:hypothetical protein M2280_004145 [Prescottella agglutinans]|uniref:Uncharacterized protein n=1 Tax=Prescottella agglutinans TaxID=1644129 RepID=A0ABT6MF32_9NOCA|nr:hypothetical protein [Prescottella agglutinans]